MSMLVEPLLLQLVHTFLPVVMTMTMAMTLAGCGPGLWMLTGIILRRLVLRVLLLRMDVAVRAVQWPVLCGAGSDTTRTGSIGMW